MVQARSSRCGGAGSPGSSSPALSGCRSPTRSRWRATTRSAWPPSWFATRWARPSSTAPRSQIERVTRERVVVLVRGAEGVERDSPRNCASHSARTRAMRRHHPSGSYRNPRRPRIP